MTYDKEYSRYDEDTKKYFENYVFPMDNSGASWQWYELPAVMTYFSKPCNRDYSPAIWISEVSVINKKSKRLFLWSLTILQLT